MISLRLFSLLEITELTVSKIFERISIVLISFNILGCENTNAKSNQKILDRYLFATKSDL